MVDLDWSERLLIRVIKGFPSEVDNIDLAFVKIYGWTRQDDPSGFEECLFRKLIDIYFKINDRSDGKNNIDKFKEIMQEASKAILKDKSFYASANEYLISLIRFVPFINSNGDNRFMLYENY